MRQSRSGSLLETAVSTAIGFAVSWCATLIVLPLFGHAVTAGPAFGITCIYTVLSVLRGYAVRRAFNRIAARRPAS